MPRVGQILAAKRCQILIIQDQQIRIAGILRKKQMSNVTKPQKRWMKSMLQTSTQAMPTLPFQRGHRSAAMRTEDTAPRLLRRA